MNRLVLSLWVACISIFSAGWANALEITVAFLRVDYQTMLPISRYDQIPPDLGMVGAQLGNQDNATTGSFLGHSFVTEASSTTPEEAEAALQNYIDQGIRLFVIAAKKDDLLSLTDQAAASGALVFNAQAPDVSLRSQDCRANLLHTATSFAQQADAVTQFALWKKWNRWLFVTGTNPEDLAMAEAYRNSARKFGAKIVEEREFEDTGGSRRTDSGHVLVQRQLPVFMQGAKDHDVVIAADKSDYFGKYLTFHKWDPRPVMGGGGLMPVQMHGSHEAYGASQLHTRFEKLAGRYIMDVDYNAWIAVRAIGEAVTRAATADPEGIKAYLLSDEFELAGFKGHEVSFRDWNGQMRQEIILYDGRITVSVSPQDGYLHQHSVQDTLGLDRPESQCTAFN